RDGIGQVGNAAGMERRAPAGKAGHGKIEAAPEEMHRARLAEEAGAELLQGERGGNQRAMEARNRIRIIGTRPVVRIETHRIGQFVGPPVEYGIAAERLDRLAEAAMEVGDGS